MDPYDAYWNQRYYAEWDSEVPWWLMHRLALEQAKPVCLNGNLCTHPACPEHEVRDFWDKTDWPILMTDSEHMDDLLRERK